MALGAKIVPFADNNIKRLAEYHQKLPENIILLQETDACPKQLHRHRKKVKYDIDKD